MFVTGELAAQSLANFARQLPGNPSSKMAVRAILSPVLLGGALCLCNLLAGWKSPARLFHHVQKLLHPRRCVPPEHDLDRGSGSPPSNVARQEKSSDEHLVAWNTALSFGHSLILGGLLNLPVADSNPYLNMKSNANLVSEDRMLKPFSWLEPGPLCTYPGGFKVV